MTKGDISVEDKVVLVSGAFGLIGRELCQSFLSQNAKVIISGHNEKDVIKIKTEFARQFPSKNFLVCGLDITDMESINRCLDKVISKFGRIDVLINNAAIDAKFDQDNMSKANVSRFENYPIQRLRESVEVNIIGTVQLTQAVCKLMISQGAGNIINVASSYSLVSPNQQLYDFGDSEIRYKPVDYVATKSFIPNYTRYVATFYARENIRCNAVAPHGIFNNHTKQFLQNYKRFSPMGRMADISEIGGPFLFLASEASSYMTGAVLKVDGGWTAW